MDFRKKSASVLLGVMALGLSASMMVSATNDTEKVKDQAAQVAEVEKKGPSADNNLSSDESKGENGQGLLFLDGDNGKKAEGTGASGNGNPDGHMFLGDVNAENGGAPKNNDGLSTGAKVGAGAAAVGIPGLMAGGYYLYDRLSGSASSEETQQQGQGSSTENQVVNNVDPVMPTEDPNNNPGVLPEPTKLVSSGLNLKTILIVVGSVIVVVATAIILRFVYKVRNSKVSDEVSNEVSDEDPINPNMNLDENNAVGGDIDKNENQQEGNQEGINSKEQLIEAFVSNWGISKNCASNLACCIDDKDTKHFLQSIGAEFLSEYQKIKSGATFNGGSVGEEAIKRCEKISSLILGDPETPGTVKCILKKSFNVVDFHDFENVNFKDYYANLMNLGNDVVSFVKHLRSGKSVFDFASAYSKISFA